MKTTSSINYYNITFYRFSFFNCIFTNIYRFAILFTIKSRTYFFRDNFKLLNCSWPVYISSNQHYRMLFFLKHKSKFPSSCRFSGTLQSSKKNN